ncbi:MAG: hydrogenase nickel incorporation protein HypB [Gemmatimonadota bacterium]
MKVEIGKEIQQSAEEAARRLKGVFDARKVLALNLVSSPGSGKTTLIEAMIGRLAGRKRIAVVEGDIETEIDAERIRKHGVQVRQITTRSSCHIPPALLLKAIERLDLDAADIVVVENVGNLVCPAEVPLGEDVRVVALSVTEGDEKPLKYPLIFKTSRILVITKTDLLPFVKFSTEAVKSAARSVNPGIEIFETSAVTGAGLPALADRIEALHADKVR